MIVQKVKTISLESGEVILCNKGFVLVRLNGDREIDLEEVKKQVEAGVKLTNGDDYVAMFDAGGTIDVNEEGMTYAANYKNNNWKAFAIVVRSISERILANYFIRFKKPVRPTKVFTNPERAIEWLSEHLKFEKPKDELLYQLEK